MIRNWKTLTMVSLLSAAATFAPQPTVVFAQDKKNEPVEVKGIKELQDSINDLIGRIDKLEKKKAPVLDQDALTDVIRTEIRAELKRLKADTTAIQQEQVVQKLRSESQKAQIDKLTEEVASLYKKLANGSAAPAVDKAFMDEFRSTLKTLNETLAKLGPTKERVMLSPPINGSATALGRVMIVNLYSEDLLFLINGAPHRVPGGMSKMIDNVPVGTLHFRVHSERWGPLTNQTANLSAGDTFTLTASNPR